MSTPARRAIAMIAALPAIWLVLWSSSDQVDALGKMILPHRAQTDRASLMTGLGTLSRNGASDFSALERQAADLARRVPLDPSPFLVTGAVAEQQGDTGRSGRLYARALAVDPRSIAAHFMLSRQALQSGDAEAALDHLSTLARLSPGAGPEFASMMVAVAADPTHDKVLRRYLASQSEQGETLLHSMSGSPTLAPRVLALAGPRSVAPEWLTPLVTTLVQQGNIAGAANAWVKYGGGPDPRAASLHDPVFARVSKSSPFGWTIEAGETGSAAPAKNGGLDVETYGREAGRLAWQWLLLKPGRYRLSAAIDRDTEGKFEWRIRCLSNPAQPFATISLGRPGETAVPLNCPAQALELWTRADEAIGGSSGHVRSVSLEPVQ